MAKSIHTTIGETTIEIQHGTQGTFTFDMPEWVNDFSEVMGDGELIADVARKHGCLHGLLHAGLQQLVINIRSKGRPADVKGETQPMDVDAGQDRIDAYVMKPVPIPGTSKVKELTPEQAADQLRRDIASGKIDKDDVLRQLGLM